MRRGSFVGFVVARVGLAAPALAIAFASVTTGAAGPGAGDLPNPYDPEPGQEEHPPDEGDTGEHPDHPRRRAEHVERRKVLLQDGMLRIPGGEFSMGNEGPPAGEPNERPAHLVQVAPFWIDRTEVTIEDMRACVHRGDCVLELGRGPACTLDRADPKLPVNCVPWRSADAYCRAVGKRLPTEAEWEFAAGGGQRARFPWGNAGHSCGFAVTLLGNRTGSSCSPKGPLAVATHPRGASYFGAEDMAGNLEEWVSDWYADRYEVQFPRPKSTASSGGPAFGVAHVIRGGGWMSRPRDARVAARNWGSLNEAGPNVGFRCAKD